MEEIKVTFWKKNKYLCEIGQQVGMKYAFLSPDNKQCHQWIKCRDFLHDALRNFINGKQEKEIFGFSYDPKVNPALTMDRMRMLVRRDPNTNETKANENTAKMMDSALNMLRCIERSNKIKPLSKLYCTEKDKNVYVFESAVDWMESTFMISLYTFIIRLSAKDIKFKGIRELKSTLKDLYKKSQSPQVRDNDLKYLKSVYPFFFKIIEKRKGLKYINDDGKKFLEDKSIDLFHNYSGVVSLAERVNPDENVNNANLEELVSLAGCLKN